MTLTRNLGDKRRIDASEMISRFGELRRVSDRQWTISVSNKLIIIDFTDWEIYPFDVRLADWVNDKAW